MQFEVTLEEALAFIEDMKENDFVSTPREHLNTMVGPMQKMKAVLPQIGQRPA
jgi:hypothetical protein